MAVREHELEAGLDNLALDAPPRPSRLARVWAAVWPKLAALALGVALWQLVVWSHWRADYVLPGPVPVLKRFWHDVAHQDLLGAIGITIRRAIAGFALALVVGTVVGLAVARVPVLRAALGALVTGLQTMPSIAWFPLAILLFKLSDTAIMFVIVVGAAPSIANGIVAGVDTIPPLLLRAGRVLGAHGVSSLRHVVIPAALPSFVSGLKQGWAFAWRSLLAGELLVPVGHVHSLGWVLHNNLDNNDAEGLLATMLAILLIGILVDSIVFGRLEQWVRRRHGLVDTALTS